MADDADVANEYIDNEVSRALGKIRENRGLVLGTMGSKICIECGEKVPDPRRKLGFRLCIECAEEIERRKSLYVVY